MMKLGFNLVSGSGITVLCRPEDHSNAQLCDVRRGIASSIPPDLLVLPTRPRFRLLGRPPYIMGRPKRPGDYRVQDIFTWPHSFAGASCKTCRCEGDAEEPAACLQFQAQYRCIREDGKRPPDCSPRCDRSNLLAGDAPCVTVGWCWSREDRCQPTTW
jgi:hypothetical protein